VQTDAEKLAGVTPVNKAYPPGDVRRYGADPTGVLDSYPAWRDAIAANVEVFDACPGGGFYRIDTEIPVSNFPRRIYGTASDPNLTSGTRFKLMSVAGSNKAVFNVADNKPNIVFEGLTFQHETTTTGQRGIIFGGDSRNCRVTRCAFMGAASVASTTKGIQFTGSGTYSAFNVVDQCYFSGHLIGIDLQGINTVTDITNCSFIGYTTSTSSYGLKCSNNSSYFIRGGHIEGFNTTSSRGIYNEGAYALQIGIRYEVNTVNWQWVRTAPNTRIYGMALAERFISGGNPIYPVNDVDACMVLTGPGFGDLDTMSLGCYRGFSERARTVTNGTYATPTFAAGSYTANGGATWTVASGNVSTHRYAWHGSRGFHWEVVLTGTATSAASPTQLIIALPASAAAAAFAQSGLCKVSIAGVWEVCSWDISSGASLLAITRLGGGSFGTVTIGVNLNAFFEIA
jgi:hypothetical protein